MADGARPFMVRIAVMPGFNLATTTAFIDPLRAANYLEGQTLCRWDLVSERGGSIAASNGIAVETGRMADASAVPDLVLVSSSWTPERHSTPALHALLRRAVRRGGAVGGLDTGGFILADAGLLAGRRATVHYEHIDAFAELHPEVEVVEDLFVSDRGRLTCCGGEASADLALQLLRERFGETVANAAARYVFHQAMRPFGMSQWPSLTEPLGRAVPEVLRTAIQTMERHLEEALPIPDIADAAGVSQRHLNRLFSLHLGKTTAQYYRDIRLDRARGLITQTEMPLAEVAIASGFRSQVSFSRAYRERFGLSPGKDRSEGRVPFEFRAWPMHRRARVTSGVKPL